MNPAPLLVVVALIAGGAVAYEPAVAPAREAATAQVTGATVICPDLRQTGTAVRTRITAGTTSGTGTAVASALRSTAAPTTLPITRPGEVAVGIGAGVSGDALVVTARGPLAGGLEVEQVTRGDRGTERGFAGLRCQPPSTSAWFVGGSTKVGNASLLVLANPDDTPAVVDVTVWTADGPVDPRPGRGLVVEPRTRAALPLDQLAPDHDLVALRVVTERGRVASALRHARVDGRTPNGVEWVPPALPPATTVVVPGLPQGPGRRVVHVTNPGADPTVVRLRLTTSTGSSEPPEWAALEVAPGTTVAADITLLTDPTPATVTVTSDGGPVLAGGFVFDAQDASVVKEMAYVGSSGPLTGPALLTDVALDRPTESTLLLSATGAAGSVYLTPLPVDGNAVPQPRQVDVPAGTTVVVRLSTLLTGGTGRLAVRVDPAPGSGPVHAARYLRERGEQGPLTTHLTLRSGIDRVAVPAVRTDPSAALR